MECLKMADKKIIVNCTTGEVTEVELTAEEVTQREADRVAEAVKKAADVAAEAALAQTKLAAQAKLAALGLTVEDLTALGL